MPSILILTQGHAGDRLGARLAPALKARFPQYEITGIGGTAMEKRGVRVLARTDEISAMGYSGLVPKLPKILRAVLHTASRTSAHPPSCVVAVDVWQPLQYLHKFGPHLKAAPHVCYLPPGPNFIGQSRVHSAAAKAFAAIVTPFPHQARLFAEAGANVRLAAHAGLQAAREEATPLPSERREKILALLPGSRGLEVRYSLPVQYEAARQICDQRRDLVPVLCCADDDVARFAARKYPFLQQRRNAREVLAEARFGVICSGTAALEAAVLGCPGVVTYHGSPLQRWEWEKFHIKPLAALRASGIASPYISLPNILSGEELYPELLGVPADEVARRALEGLAGDLPTKCAALQRVTDTLPWNDAGETVADCVGEALESSSSSSSSNSSSPSSSKAFRRTHHPR